MKKEEFLVKILKTSFDSKVSFGVASQIVNAFIMVNKTRKKNSINLGTILATQNLEIRETGFFQGKRNVIKVTDRDGRRGILKIGRIDRFQVELSRLAKELENNLCFKVPEIWAKGPNWFLMREIKGKDLNNFYEEKVDWVLELSRDISESYKLLSEQFCLKNQLEISLPQAEKRLYGAINHWSKPILDAGLIEFREIQRIKNDFEEVIKHKGVDFFSWVHGNIIGDHILIANNKPYLLDLAISNWPGVGYYDFLRALDFYFLRAENADLAYHKILERLDRLCDRFGEEIKLVFALRMIGVLGHDMIRNKISYLGGDFERKRDLALAFISRQY